MAFTGTPVVENVADNCVRITGVSLGIGAAGTLAFAEGTGEAEFTCPKWNPHADVSFQDAIEVRPVLVSAESVAPALQIVKTGTTKADFVATITNGGAAASGTLEFYVFFH
jgi:hypothetical protein